LLVVGVIERGVVTVTFAVADAEDREDDRDEGEGEGVAPPSVLLVLDVMMDGWLRCRLSMDGRWSIVVC